MSDSISVFSDEFLGQLAEALEEKCADGGSMTKSEVCEALSLDADFAPTIGTVVSMGLLPDFEVRRARGISKVGVTPTRRATATSATSASVELSDEFLEELKATLEDMCPQPKDGKVGAVPRRDVAAAMGTPGYKAEQMISAALRRDDFEDFKMRRGKNGGICRVVEEVPEEEEVVTVEATEAVAATETTESTETTETTEEAGEILSKSEEGEDDIAGVSDEEVMELVSEEEGEEEEEEDPLEALKRSSPSLYRHHQQQLASAQQDEQESTESA
jgi:hypothetical protein